jgi:hypothetical protein
MRGMVGAHPARVGARLRLVGSGRTPLESARAYAWMPPDEAETEGAWVRTRWRAGRGPIGQLA